MRVLLSSVIDRFSSYRDAAADAASLLAESINRHLDDTMWLGRTHSVGHARQHLNLLGFALTVNSLALYPHREREAPPLAA